MSVYFSRVIDFYHLEYVLSTLNESSTNRAEERLYQDVKAEYDTLTSDLALALFQYLYLACLGEASLASKCAREWCFADLERSGDRGYTVRQCIRYNPELTLPSLVELFDSQDWSSAYGGTRWAEIAEYASMYFTLSHSAFIDRVIDLEHNGGLCYDKSDVASVAGLRLNLFSNLALDWYSYKTTEDILNHPWYNVAEYLAPKTARLVCRYFRVVLRENPNPVFTISVNGLYNSENEEGISPDVIEWGNDTLAERISVSQCSCYACDGGMQDEDSYYCDICGKTFCEVCFCNHTSPCEECQELVHSDDLVNTCDAKYLCEECAKECESCNENFSKDSLVYDTFDDALYCDDCLAEIIAGRIECQRCEEILPKEDTIELYGYTYCEECYTRIVQDNLDFPLYFPIPCAPAKEQFKLFILDGPMGL